MNITLENYFNMLVEAEFLALCFVFSFWYPHRRHFLFRSISLAICFVGLSFLFECIDVGNFIISNSLNFSLVFLTGFLYLLLCFDYPVQSTLFLSVVSYSFRHIIYLLWQLLTYIVKDCFSYPIADFSYVWVILAIISILVYVPAGFFLYFRIKTFPDVALPRARIIIAAIFSMFVTIVLNSFSLYYDFDSFSPSLPYVLNVFSFLASGMIVLLLMGNAKEAKLKGEIDAINQLRHQEAKQYKMSKESIDLINIKCHDLRHQIRNLKNTHKTISGDELSQIEDAIRIYDTRVKTGNDSLDIILQEKSLICQKNMITFDYIIDGGQLSFMKENDTYSLFGNIIDNSIEACMNISDSNKRIIRLKVKNVANGVLAIEENPYNGDFRMENGLPMSTKKDSRFHGFGMKSIQHIVNTYHGTMNISAENHTYRISIFFPEMK
jgi:hypothetical protein